MSDINVCQIDPEINFTFPIFDMEFAGDSLDTINLNFQSLNNALSNITFSADAYWNPFFDQFNDKLADWDGAYTMVQEFSSCWNDAYTTVQTFSAAWLTPLTIVYPHPFNKDATSIGTMLTWVKSNFPVKTGSCINYLNGQKMYIYSMEYAVNNQVARSNCSFNTANLQFTLYYIENGSGKMTKTVPAKGSSRIYRYGLAGVSFQGISPNYNTAAPTQDQKLTDKYIGEIVGIEFCVQNDEWVSLGLLSGY
jgi:hypothetical protein